MEPNATDRWRLWSAQVLPIAPGWQLRPLVATDIPALVASVDHHVRRGLKMDRVFGHNEGARLVTKATRQLAERGRGAMWGIAQEPDDPHTQDSSQPTSVVQGVLSLHASDDNRAQVGYWLGPQARGRGLATAAVRAISEEFASPVTGHNASPGTGQNAALSGLTWVSPVGNVDSLRVVRAAGFRPIGTCAAPTGAGGQLHPSWYAEWTPTVDTPDRHWAEPDRAWADCLVEIAAGAWQLQPMDSTNAAVAEQLLPLSACVPIGVWAAKEITTARVDAVVALLRRGERAWVLAEPATSAATASEAAAAASEVVGRYARGALGLITP